jgi:uncharacterized protein
MNKEEALDLIKSRVKNQNSIKHMLATEAIMRALAKHFNEDQKVWGLAGLLHDLDMEDEECLVNLSLHANKAAEELDSLGVDKKITDAIRAHNDMTGKTRDTLIEKCIYAVDPLTGLIVAATLVLPSKKLKDLKLKSLQKRFKEGNFAKGARREGIKACTDFDMDLEEFLEIGLKAMQGITDDLGL